uniref:Uncharacterized protein n=1 Tax=Aegilops tauschii TaxID=37682 RepID=R7W7F5_AEGTA
MADRKVVVMLLLALLLTSQLVMLAEAGNDDVLPSDELSLEVLALMEDIIHSKLCPAACIACLVQIGKACPLNTMMFAPCVLGQVMANGCFSKE